MRNRRRKGIAPIFIVIIFLISGGTIVGGPVIYDQQFGLSTLPDSHFYGIERFGEEILCAFSRDKVVCWLEKTEERDGEIVALQAKHDGAVDPDLIASLQKFIEDTLAERRNQFDRALFYERDKLYAALDGMEDVIVGSDPEIKARFDELNGFPIPLLPEIDNREEQKCIEEGGTWHDGVTSCMPVGISPAFVSICHRGCELSPSEEVECVTDADCPPVKVRDICTYAGSGDYAIHLIEVDQICNIHGKCVPVTTLQIDSPCPDKTYIGSSLTA